MQDILWPVSELPPILVQTLKTISLSSYLHVHPVPCTPIAMHICTR